MHLSQLHKSDGFAYNILVYLCQLGQYGTVRRMELFGKDKLPLDRPLIIAANHPTAFMDPILFTTLFDQPMYNMTRGDIFEKPMAHRMLISMNMFPVYRARDGYGTSRRNAKVFSYVINKLKEQKSIVMFVEGQHHLDTSLKPLQKGIAHIAQYGLETEPSLENMLIVPIGVNYRWGNRIWDDASVTVGEPYEAAPWLGPNSEIPQAERSARFLADLEQRLRTLVHHLDTEADQPLFDMAKDMVRSEVRMPVLPQVKRDSRVSFDMEQVAVKAINGMAPEAKAELHQIAATYADTLKKAGITDREVVVRSTSLVHFIQLLLGFVPFLVGMVGALPMKLATTWLLNAKVKKAEFYTSVLMGAGIVVATIWYSAIIIWSILTWKPLFIAAALSLPLLGWFTNPYYELWNKFTRGLRFDRYTDKEGLRGLRKQVFGGLFGSAR